MYKLPKKWPTHFDGIWQNDQIASFDTIRQDQKLQSKLKDQNESWVQIHIYIERAVIIDGELMGCN